MDTEQFMENVEENIDNNPRAALYVDMSGGDANISMAGNKEILLDQTLDMAAAIVHHLAMNSNGSVGEIVGMIERRARELGGHDEP